MGRNLQWPNSLCAARYQGLDDWLTVHRSITLVDHQLDEQNSYLFTYNTFIKILYMFRALSSFLTGAQDSHLQRVTIPEAAYI